VRIEKGKGEERGECVGGVRRGGEGGGGWGGGTGGVIGGEVGGGQVEFVSGRKSQVDSGNSCS